MRERDPKMGMWVQYPPIITLPPQSDRERSRDLVDAARERAKGMHTYGTGGMACPPPIHDEQDEGVSRELDRNPVI